MMKSGILSVAIGMVGLVLLTYAIYQANIDYQNEQPGIATLYTMHPALKIALFAVEAGGAGLGFYSFKRYGTKSGLVGIALCMLCLMLLFSLQ